MKKIILSIILFIPLYCLSQGTVIRTAPVSSTVSAPNYNKQVVQDANLSVLLTFSIPVVDTPKFNNANTRNGAMVLAMQDSALYVFFNGQWRRASGSPPNVSNGLSKSGDTIIMGGTINRNTTLDISSGKTFKFNDTTRGAFIEIDRGNFSMEYPTISGGNTGRISCAPFNVRMEALDNFGNITNITAFSNQMNIRSVNNSGSFGSSITQSTSVILKAHSTSFGDGEIQVFDGVINLMAHSNFNIGSKIQLNNGFLISSNISGSLSGVSIASNGTNSINIHDASSHIGQKYDSSILTSVAKNDTNWIPRFGAVKSYADSVSTGTAISTHFIFNETPSGTINGSNVTFNLAFTPISGKFSLYKNGVKLKPTTDYTISGNTITYVVAPVTTPSLDILLADYIK